MKVNKELVLKYAATLTLILLAPFFLSNCGGGSGPAPDNVPGLPPYISVSPDDTGDGWSVSTPAEENMDAHALFSGLENVRDGELYRHVDSVIVARNGRLVAEAYFNGYGADTLHDLRSASKSITSALAGIAIEQAAFTTESTLTELVDKLENYKNPDERKAAIKIINLLNMNSGLNCNDWNPSSPGNEEKMYDKLDWVGFVLDLPMAKAPGGEQGTYCTGGVILLGHIIATHSGMDLEDFANNWLFGPLGIQDVLWRYSPEGTPMGGGGMRLRPRDAAKFGQLYLNAGVWDNEQVVPEQWVARSQERMTTLPTQQKDGYGLLWWKRELQLTNGRTREMFFASGNGGNYIFLIPDEQLNVVFSGSKYGNTSIDEPFIILDRYILPTLID